MFSSIRQSGSAFLIVMILAVVVGFIAMSVIDNQRSINDQISHTDKRGEFSDLQRYVKNLVDCPKTLTTNATCTPGATVAIYKNATDLLIRIPSGTTYTKVGPFSLRAKCGATPTEFEIEANHVNGFKCEVGSASCWIELFPSPLVCS